MTALLLFYRTAGNAQGPRRSPFVKMTKSGQLLRAASELVGVSESGISACGQQPVAFVEVTPVGG
jgi:hypothetical protein